MFVARLIGRISASLRFASNGGPPGMPTGRVEVQRYVQDSTSFRLVTVTSVTGSGKPYESFN